MRLLSRLFLWLGHKLASESTTYEQQDALEAEADHYAHKEAAGAAFGFYLDAGQAHKERTSG